MPPDSLQRILRKPRISYADFILGDHNKRIRQISSLLKLYDLQCFYLDNNVSDASYSDCNSFSKKNCIDWAFELFRMRKAIVEGRPYAANNSVAPMLTRQANQVLLLAMIHGHREIVSYFLKSRLMSINQSIFGSSHWPSYFLLACTCSDEVFGEFQKYWINNNIAWNGLTPSILATLSKNTLEKHSYLDFLTYQQYTYLNEFRGISIVGTDEALPVFLLDFACMISDRLFLKQILDSEPEAGYLSRLSFIVQSKEHLILILSRYGFRTEQQFNGNTPLHYSCYNNDFCILSILLYIGFPIRQDKNGRFPNEVGSHKMREKTSIFFNLCAGLPQRRSPQDKPARVFSHESFRENMTTWMKVLKYNPDEFDKYIGIFKYLDFNKNNKILRKSRFNIINALGFSKTPVSVERCVQNMIACPFVAHVYSTSEALILHARHYG